MNRTAQRVSELASLYLDGQARPEEVRELEALLSENDEARAAFLNEVHLSDGLKLMIEPSAEAMPVPAGRGSGRLIHFLAPLALAATVLIAVGVFIFVQKAAPPAMPAGVAYAKSVGSGVKLWRDGR